VLTALRLLYRDRLGEIRRGILELIASWEDLSSRYGHVSLPGFTHMRKAMPSSIRMWCGAFIASARDLMPIDVSCAGDTALTPAARSFCM
jgi:argininosuccinate lyase